MSAFPVHVDRLQLLLLGGPPQVPHLFALATALGERFQPVRDLLDRDVET